MLCSIRSAKRLFALLVVTLCLPSHSFANTKSFDDIIEQDFWKTIYKDGGQCFYTKKEFTKKSPLLVESFIYPKSGMRDHLSCGTDRQCKRESPDYLKMISDLHNLVVAKSSLALKLNSSTFGILDQSIEPDEFGMRARFHLIEPSNDIKGDVARVIYYMHKTYELPIRGNVSDFLIWNESDPPSAEEIARNDLIESIQGARNPYVDNPSLMKP